MPRKSAKQIEEDNLESDYKLMNENRVNSEGPENKWIRQLAKEVMAPHRAMHTGLAYRMKNKALPLDVCGLIADYSSGPKNYSAPKKGTGFVKLPKDIGDWSGSGYKKLRAHKTRKNKK